eukprot:TRINITY_DN4192_c0_g1_i1.p1 TRINITY_DN4192_c0_g1~~TRINITY_DN4192_c0_g1_i1.p1  ORF type:complete len:1243 (-),score=310.37 TRINITY_DN4192_c0_g1_i1:198-3926(-)
MNLGGSSDRGERSFSLEMGDKISLLDNALRSFQENGDRLCVEAEDATLQRWQQWSVLSQQQQQQQQQQIQRHDQQDLQDEHDQDLDQPNVFASPRKDHFSKKMHDESNSESQRGKSAEAHSAHDRWFLNEQKNVVRRFHRGVVDGLTTFKRTLMLQLEEIRFHVQAVETELSSWHLKYDMELLKTKGAVDRHVDELTREWDDLEHSYMEQIQGLQKQLAVKSEEANRLQRESEHMQTECQAEIKRVLSVIQPGKIDNDPSMQSDRGRNLQKSLSTLLTSFQSTLEAKAAKQTGSSKGIHQAPQSVPSSSDETASRGSRPALPDYVTSELQILRLELEKRVAQYEATKMQEAPSTKAELQQLRTENLSLEKKNVELHETIRRLTVEMEKQASAYESTKKELQPLLKRIAEYEANYASLSQSSSQAKRLESDMAKKDRELQALQMQVSTLSASESRIRQEKDILAQQIDLLNQSLSKTESALSSGSSSSAQLEAQISLLKGKMKDAASKHQKELESLRLSLEDTQRERDELQQRLSETPRRMSKVLSPPRGTDNSLVDDLYAQINTLRRVNEELSINLSALTIRLREEETKGVGLQRENLEQAARLKVRDADGHQPQHEVSALNEKLRALSAENEELRRQLEDQKSRPSILTSGLRMSQASSSPPTSARSKESFGGEIRRIHGFIEDEQEFLMKVVDEMETWKQEFHNELENTKLLKSEIQNLEAQLVRMTQECKILKEECTKERQLRTAAEQEVANMRLTSANTSVAPQSKLTKQDTGDNLMHTPQSRAFSLATTSSSPDLTPVKQKAKEVSESASTCHRAFQELSSGMNAIRSLSSELSRSLLQPIVSPLDTTLEQARRVYGQDPATPNRESENLLVSVQTQMEELESVCRSHHHTIKPNELIRFFDQLKRYLRTTATGVQQSPQQRPNQTPATTSKLVMNLSDEIASWDVRFYQCRELCSLLNQESEQLVTILRSLPNTANTLHSESSHNTASHYAAGLRFDKAQTQEPRESLANQKETSIDFRLLLSQKSKVSEDGYLSLAQGLAKSPALVELREVTKYDFDRKFVDTSSAKTLAIVFGVFSLDAKCAFLDGMLKDSPIAQSSSIRIPAPLETPRSALTPRVDERRLSGDWKTFIDKESSVFSATSPVARGTPEIIPQAIARSMNQQSPRLLNRPLAERPNAAIEVSILQEIAKELPPQEPATPRSYAGWKQRGQSSSGTGYFVQTGRDPTPYLAGSKPT